MVANIIALASPLLTRADLSIARQLRRSGVKGQALLWFQFCVPAQKTASS